MSSGKWRPFARPHVLTRCGLVTPFDKISRGKYWLYIDILEYGMLVRFGLVLQGKQYNDNMFGLLRWSFNPWYMHYLNKSQHLIMWKVFAGDWWISHTKGQ